MPASSSNRIAVAAVVCTLLFAAVYPLSVHFVTGGQVSGILFTIPLIMIGWRWGFRPALLAAFAGILYTRTIFGIEYFAVQHNNLDSVWIMTFLEASLVYLVTGIAFGKLSDGNRAREAAQQAAHEAERRYKELIDLIPQGISIVQDSRFMLCNRHMTRSGYSVEELMSVPFTDFNPPKDRQISIDLQERVLKGNGEEERAELRVTRRNGETLWLEVTARKVEWKGRPASLCSSADITQRKTAEKALQDGNAHLEAILKAVPDLMFEVDREGRFYPMPTPHPELLVAEPDVYVGRTVRDILPPEAAEIGMNAVARAAETGTDFGAFYSLVMNGAERWYELSVSAIGDHSAPDAHFIVLARDITERKRMEQQFAQAQKMEAVGRLAGGIAHDFNNILLVVQGFADLISEHADDEKEVVRDIRVVKESAARAASLTQQLLAFSRKQMIQKVVRDLNAFLRSTEEMLKRLLGEDIQLRITTQGQASWVNVDPGQLQQVILNLAANARDAMPMGGTLFIEACEAEIDALMVGAPQELRPGKYALLTVRDTGLGMDKQTLSHIFEPFFTTKEVGKGTGLGLSIVYGTIKQLGGFIYAESRQGAGTIFKVYLPSADGAEEHERPSSRGSLGGTETILLVEDEDPVRTLLARSLNGWGYSVVEARSGEDALRICQGREGPIHLVLTDVIMPGMRGGKAAGLIRAVFPDAPVIFMTGYADDFDELKQLSGPASTLLRKPFSIGDLQQLVRRVLDAAHPSSADGSSPLPAVGLEPTRRLPPTRF